MRADGVSPSSERRADHVSNALRLRAAPDEHLKRSHSFRPCFALRLVRFGAYWRHQEIQEAVQKWSREHLSLCLGDIMGRTFRSNDESSVKIEYDKFSTLSDLVLLLLRIRVRPVCMRRLLRIFEILVRRPFLRVRVAMYSLTDVECRRRWEATEWMSKMRGNRL